MPRKKTSKLFNAFILLMLGAALWLEYAPYIMHWDEITRVRQHTVALTGTKVTALLENKEKKPTLIFLYASWCSNCAPVGQALLEMKKNHKLDDVNTVFISLDEKPVEMARYFVTNGYYAEFTPYMFQPHVPHGLEQALVIAGSRYDGGIPYAGLFGGDGQLLAERLDDFSQTAIATMFAMVRQSKAPQVIP
jgi:hypothetical protein